MSHCGRVTVLALAVALVAASPTGAARNAATRGGDTATILVKFRTDSPPAARTAALAHVGGRVEGRISRLEIIVVTIRRGRVGDALRQLRRSQVVKFAERERSAVRLDTVPNDYWWPNEWSQRLVNAPRAWDITTGSANTVVAILDTGIDASQPDLQGTFVGGWNTLAGAAETTDNDGHGTLAAGVAVARGNNSIGIASYCWTCSLMPVKVIDTNAGTFSSVASGITWAVDHGARVISLSLGFTSSSSTLQSAVRYAHDRNAIIVAAAGNYGNTTPVYPAAYPEVLSVAGTDGSDALYSWSNFGSWVKLAAPGCNFTTGRSAWYGTFCGTSSAAPALAGVAALAASFAPLASNTQIEQALQTAAAPIGASVQYGRVDAYQTLVALGTTSAATAPSNTAVPAVGGTSQEGQTLTATTGTWSGSAPMAYTYQWRRCDSNGSNCSTIPGATASSYSLTSGDVGSTLAAAVTASNNAGAATATSAATAVVAAAPAPSPGSTTTTSTSFSGSLNKGQSSRAFAVAVGTGSASAALSFAKSPSLSLTVKKPDGSPVGTATGASVLSLVTNMSAGNYTYVVSGSSSASFTLNLKYTAP